MSPIPEDNQDKPPDKDCEINNFSNPNLVTALDVTGSSDDSDEDGNETAVPSGYSLLPQEPVDNRNNDDSDEDESNIDHIGAWSTPVRSDMGGGDDDEVLSTVLISEGGAAAPSVSFSTVADTSHPTFPTKFSDGKVPAHMQVSSVPRDKAQESKILKAMSGISLPCENIPDWARNLPDDKWQQQVVDRIGSSVTSTIAKPAPVSTQSNSNSSLQKSIEEQYAISDEEWVATFPESNDTMH